ncbi:MAG: polysaccharide pyruvyl transferase family protein [Clostridia bacterium]|nr:polysaccharide pyruvyl transferase family protein [Clostridia bacterium]
MMKVGILTFPNSVSYGATLQMYALCRAVERLGHEAEAINYYNVFMKAELHCKSTAKSEKKYRCKRIIKSFLHRKLYRKFAAFEKDVINLFPKKSFTDKALLPEIGTRYDAVICGSDQVWNPNITGGDLSYFLNFCGQTTRRVAYAPSFGVEILPEALKDQAREELKLFSEISVREVQGQALVTDMIGREVPVVIDPTMLLEREEWEKIEVPYRKIKGDYILYFTVKSSHRLFQKCRDFAKKNGLTMVVVGGNFLKKIKNNDPTVQYATCISPAEWLWLIHHAKYVATNSFHGTAFSIIFEKDFYLELSAATNSRLINIVRILALENQILSEEADMIPTKADYKMARENMLRLQEDSLSYLKNALREDVNHG